MPDATRASGVSLLGGGSPSDVQSDSRFDTQFPEAFALAQYRCDEHRHDYETVWNSRDGVLPVVLRMNCGNNGTFAHWRPLRHDRTHIPAVGERIVVDLTPTRARIIAMHTASYWWNDTSHLGQEVHRIYSSELELIAGLYSDMALDLAEGAPDVIHVSADLARERGWQLPS